MFFKKTLAIPRYVKGTSFVSCMLVMDLSPLQLTVSKRVSAVPAYVTSKLRYAYSIQNGIFFLFLFNAKFKPKRISFFIFLLFNTKSKYKNSIKLY